MDDKLSVSYGSPTSDTTITSAKDCLENVMAVYDPYTELGTTRPYYTAMNSYIDLRLTPWTVYYSSYRVFSPDDIVDVQFFPKVVKMTFKNGVTTIAKLQEGDEYSKETGMMICIMEYIFQSKRYNNLFRKWIKNDEKHKADKIKAEKRAEEEKNIKKHQEEKEARKKAARKEKKKQEAIEIQKEAIKQALDERWDADKWWCSTTDYTSKNDRWVIPPDDAEKISATASKILNGEV